MDEKVKNKEADTAEDQDSELDEELEETFPASDPGSETQPGEGASDDKDKPK